MSGRRNSFTKVSVGHPETATSDFSDGYGDDLSSLKRARPPNSDREAGEYVSLDKISLAASKKIRTYNNAVIEKDQEAMSNVRQQQVINMILSGNTPSLASNSLDNEEDDGPYVMDSIGRWTKYEHNQFLKGLRTCGKNWREIAGNFCTTRTEQQIRTHAASYFEKISKLPCMGGIQAKKGVPFPPANVALNNDLIPTDGSSGISAFESMIEATHQVPMPSSPIVTGVQPVYRMPIQASSSSNAMNYVPAAVTSQASCTVVSDMEVMQPLKLPKDPAAHHGLVFNSPQALAHYNQYMLSIAAQYYQMAAMYQPPTPEALMAFNAPPVLPSKVTPSGASQPTQRRSASISEATIASVVSSDGAEAPAAVKPSGPVAVPLLPNMDTIITSAVSVAINQYLPQLSKSHLSLQNNPSQKLHIKFASNSDLQRMESLFTQPLMGSNQQDDDDVDEASSDVEEGNDNNQVQHFPGTDLPPVSNVQCPDVLNSTTDRIISVSVPPMHSLLGSAASIGSAYSLPPSAVPAVGPPKPSSVPVRKIRTHEEIEQQKEITRKRQQETLLKEQEKRRKQQEKRELKERLSEQDILLKRLPYRIAEHQKLLAHPTAANTTSTTTTNSAFDSSQAAEILSTLNKK